MVNVFDPEARLIRRGKLSAKTEFGHKALLAEIDEQVDVLGRSHLRAMNDKSFQPPGFPQSQQHIPVESVIASHLPGHDEQDRHNDQ